MLVSTRSALALAFAFAASPLTAQAEPTPVVIGTEHAVRSDVLDEERRVLIYRPADYDASDDRYPVLYLLDGRSHFHHTTGIVDFLAANHRIPPMLVVGIRNTDRTRDLTPTAEKDGDPRFASAGGADRFLTFLTDELTPWLDANYRTRPVRVLVGHSFGGLFAVHALQAKANFFAGLIAISPSMQWDDQELVTRTGTWLDGKPEVDGALYLSAGNEGIGLLGGTHKIAGLLAEKAPPTLRWSFEHLARETHGSVPHRSTYDGLEFVFDGWALHDPLALFDVGGVHAIVTHYRSVRARFGYDAKIPGMSWQPLLSGLISAGRFDDASDAAVEIGTAVPPEFWDFLASQFEDQDDADGANESYRRCLTVHPFHAPARRKLLARDIEPPPLPADVEVPADVLNAYAGRYRLAKYAAVLTVTVDDGTLHVAGIAATRQRLHATSTTEFASEIGMKFVFRVDAAGVGQLSIDRGEILRCERLTDDGGN